MIRGLLTLRLNKASRIRKIEITLRGASRTEWPEGIGPRRMETSEEHIILEETITFFTASASHSRSRDRRAVSVGPGSYFEEEPYDDFDEGEMENGSLHQDHAYDRGRAPQRGGAGRSFSVAAERMMPGALATTPSSRRTSFDRLPGEAMANGHGNRGGPAADALSEAILTRERGPSPAYSPQDPLAPVRHQRTHSLLRNERGEPTGGGLSPIPSAAPSRDASQETQMGSTRPTRPSVGPANASGSQGPIRARIPSLSHSMHLDGTAEEELPMTNGHGDFSHHLNAAQSTSSHSAASSIFTRSHPGSPRATRSPVHDDPPALDMPPPQVDRQGPPSALQQEPRRGSMTPANGPTVVDDQEYISVSRRGSRQTSLVELVPSPAGSPSLRPVDATRPGRGTGALLGSPSSSRRSSGIGQRPSMGQLRSAVQSGSSTPPTENATASSSTPAAPSTQDRGRKSSKFSLASALRGISMDVKDRVSHGGRAVSRNGREESAGETESRASGSSQTVDIGLHPPFGRGGAARSVSAARRTASPDGSADRSGSRSRGRAKGLKVLTDAMGLDDDERESGDVNHNWKEFRKGTYNYPISFAIPASSPPTIHADFGSVTYRLRATVHRAGALTPNLVEDMEVFLIASPNEDDLEESENIIVERQWEDQMRYLIALSGKAFPIGGTIPMSLRMMPMSKCKIYRLTASIEEKIDYFAMERRVARHEAPRKYPLLALKGAVHDKVAEPLLPIISDSPSAVAESPLAPLAIQGRQVGEDEDDAAASLLNPHGPWFLETTLQVPDCAARIRFSSKHQKTNMAVGHWLKVVIRVERGDDKALDAKGKRKQFDIIIETPLHLLDCRVNAQYNTLPTYSTTSALAMSNTASQCSVHGTKTVGADSRIGAATQGATSTPVLRQQTLTVPTSGPVAIMLGTDRSGAEVAPVGPRPDDPDTLLQRNIVYDRLISGQESEAGEAPPTYVEAVSTRGGSRSRSRHEMSRSRSGLGREAV